MKFLLTFLILSTTSSVVLAQYGPNEDNILPYNPPGFVPPMPPTDPPGYEQQLTNEATTAPSKLRPPPLPSWTKKLPQDNEVVTESSGQQSKIVDNNKGLESSGDGLNGTEGSGEGSGFDGSGDDFPDIMMGMDKEAEVLGINCPTDIIFVIDATSSIRGIFEQLINYLEKVIEGLDISPHVDRVGAIVYSSEKKQRMKIPLGKHQDMASLMKAVDELPFFSGITATGQALKFAANHTEGRRDNFTLNYVVLTDGFSYDFIESGAKLLRSVPNSAIYAVSVGDVYIKKELEMISGHPDNVFIGSMSYGSLVKRLKYCGARAEARVQHDAGFDNSLVHPGEFMSNRKQHKTGTDASIEAPDNQERIVIEQPVKDCKYDIGIIFDSSGSLMQNFQRQLAYANQLISQMPISANSTRVGVIQFAGKTKTRVLVDFRQNKTQSELKTVIDRCPFYSGTTFTNQALKRMAKLFEDASRTDGKCKLVVFTDGYSAEDTSEGIEALKSRGVEIYTVGISTEKNVGLNMNELRGMATSPEHYYDSNDFEKLLKHFPSTEYCA